MSGDDLLDLRFIMKNATMAPITKMDITIPATPPPPMPDFLLLLFPFDWLLLPLGFLFWLPLLVGGVPGGGGGAGPEFHELPSLLL